MFLWLSVKSSFGMWFCLLWVSATQSKQKSVISCRSDSTYTPGPYLFIFSLWFFLTSFLQNRGINQFIINYVIHALLWGKNPKQPNTREHNCDLNSFVILNYHLIFFCLFWYYVIPWHNFDSEECIVSCFHGAKGWFFFFTCWNILSVSLHLSLHLQNLQKMAGNRRREVLLITLQLALLPARRLK